MSRYIGKSTGKLFGSKWSENVFAQENNAELAQTEFWTTNNKVCFKPIQIAYSQSMEMDSKACSFNR